MEALLLKSNSRSDLKLLLELAKKLGVDAKSLSSEDIEDIGMANSIKKGKTGEYIEPEEFIEKLRKKS